MNKRILLTAAFFGCIAVVLGAFGSHGLRGKVTEYQLDIWETAVSYQFYHTFALLFLSTFSRAKNNYIRFSYYCFTLGIFLFSGSLYIMSSYELLGWQKPVFLGPITPIGGLGFMLGWVGLFVATFKNK